MASAADIVTCDGCGSVFPYDDLTCDGLDHERQLCEDCAPSCTTCARDRAADLEADRMREDR